MPNQYTNHRLCEFDAPNVSGVYLLTSLLDGTTYVGASVHMRKRLSEHFCEMAAGRFSESPYRAFEATYKQAAEKGFAFHVLELCGEAVLRGREAYWMRAIRPTANQYTFCAAQTPYTEQERARKSARAKALWATPEYRERAIAARKGKAYCKGYKCTPEQVENRRRAARISNMKRAHGAGWRATYVARYPEHAGDLDA